MNDIIKELQDFLKASGVNVTREDIELALTGASCKRNLLQWFKYLEKGKELLRHNKSECSEYDKKDMPEDKPY